MSDIRQFVSQVETATVLLIEGLERRGVALEPTEDGRLRIQPASSLTPRDLAAVKTLKMEILKLLSRRFPARQAGKATNPFPPCSWCRGTRLWLSVYGVIACAACHPPACESLVARWIGRGLQGQRHHDLGTLAHWATATSTQDSDHAPL